MADKTALPLTLLAEKFASLPGIGMKSAQRLAYHIIKLDDDKVEAFAEALLNAKKSIHMCSVCMNFTEKELCPICDDPQRDASTICVVETPKDITAFERSGEYHGVYHVLHGLISPVDGVMPDNLRIRELLERINNDDISEVIMAVNPTVEGDATSMYIAKLLKPFGIKVTRLAFGIPVGGTLEYTDEQTLFRALENRNVI